nr:hypothetical protein [Tanacetum cinerariifolium]
MICTSCIKQFWTSAKVKTINEDVRLQALVDGKKVIVNKASIRRDLRLDDAEGTDSLPSGEDRLQLNELIEICTKLSDRVLSLEQINTNQAFEIEKLKKRVKNLKGKKKKRTHRMKRIYKGRIVEIDVDENLSLINETVQDQGRMNDLDGDEVVVDVSAREKEEQSKKVAIKKVSTANPVTTVGEVVNTDDVEVSAALTTTTTTDDELTLAQTLIKIKAAKTKALTTAAITVLVAKMFEPERPLKRKEQIMMDEQIDGDLEAQMQADLEEEKRIAKQKEDEANIAIIVEWYNTQAMMDADYELATKLQEEEKEELSIEEKLKLFVELMNKRKKHFEILRAE